MGNWATLNTGHPVGADTADVTAIAARIDNCEDGLSGTDALTAVDIDGGAIDGVVLGAGTPAAATFTCLVTSMLVVSANASITGSVHANGITCTSDIIVSGTFGFNTTPTQAQMVLFGTTSQLFYIEGSQTTSNTVNLYNNETQVSGNILLIYQDGGACSTPALRVYSDSDLAAKFQGAVMLSGNASVVGSINISSAISVGGSGVFLSAITGSGPLAIGTNASVAGSINTAGATIYSAVVGCGGASFASAIIGSASLTIGTNISAVGSINAAGATYTSNVTVGNNFVSASQLAASGPVYFSSGLLVSGTAQFIGFTVLAVSGMSTVGSVVIGSTATVLGDFTANGSGGVGKSFNVTTSLVTQGVIYAGSQIVSSGNATFLSQITVSGQALLTKTFTAGSGSFGSSLIVSGALQVQGAGTGGTSGMIIFSTDGIFYGNSGGGWAAFA